MSERVWFDSCTRSVLMCERLGGLTRDLVCVCGSVRSDGTMQVGFVSRI